MKKSTSKKFSLKSFLPAINGIFITFTEPNFKFHIATTFLVTIGGLLLHISNTEWCLLLLSIGFVLSAEIFNTAIEHIMNFIHPKPDIGVGKIKDLAAAAVLISSITAAIVGLLIFVPKLLELLN